MKFYQENSFFSINCGGHLLDLSQPKIMGIVNLTPDSFSDGGKFNSELKALRQAEQLLKEGASILDLGAQSTRPNAEKISAQNEIQRFGKIISTLKKEFPEVIISLDSFYAEVVRFGFNEGMDIVNDISGGQYDHFMFDTVAELGVPYILMHVNPEYEHMHKKLLEGDIAVQLNTYFSEKIAQLREKGVKDIILDPGFGFGKTLEQNLKLIDDFQFLGFGRLPLLAGISRKSFIYKPLGKKPLEINMETQNLHLQLLQSGAKILRVHDVAEAQQTLRLFLSKAN